MHAPLCMNTEAAAFSCSTSETRAWLSNSLNKMLDRVHASKQKKNELNIINFIGREGEREIYIATTAIDPTEQVLSQVTSTNAALNMFPIGSNSSNDARIQHIL